MYATMKETGRNGVLTPTAAGLASLALDGAELSEGGAEVEGSTEGASEQ
jgi:hypothetical protein